MKKLIIALALTLVAINVNATEVFSKFNLTGFKVNIVHAKKFSYSCQSDSVENVDGTLILKATSDKETLTIYTPTLEAIALTNCDLTISSKFAPELLGLTMDKSSTANIDIKAKQMDINLTGNSLLTLSGDIISLNCTLDAVSKIESAQLKLVNMKLTVADQSIATLILEAKNLEVYASNSSGITLKGTAEVLKCNSTFNSIVKATRLQVPVAIVNSQTDSKIALNSASSRLEDNMTKTI